jgi:uncharacterized protein YcfJ
MPVRHTLAALVLLASALVARPALAEGGDAYPAALPPIPDGPHAAPGPVAGYSVEQRDHWLAECRDRVGDDDGVGGAVIGGVIGGVAGNRIAGRGNRVVGTVVGAGVGAVAGAAIDRAEDRGEAADFCETYLDRYEASFAGAGAGYAYGGYGPGAYGYPYYAGRVMWVPVRISGGCCNCKPRERVVEEWVDEPAPPPARRVIRDKRIKLQPSKYVKTKYSK